MKRYIVMLLFCLSFIQNVCQAEVFCPLCEQSSKEFIGYKGVNTRPHCRCSNCNSLERHRHLWLCLKRHYSELFTQKITLLHWAPEDILCKYFRSLPNIQYIGADISPYKRECPVGKYDITDTAIKDNSIDVIICSHVLEHVLEDKKALSETIRVLKPGGYAFIMVPFYHNLKKTYEDPSIVTPKGREKAFDHFEHVRKYGWDLVKRMEDVGFTVNMHLLTALSPEERVYYGLDSFDDDIFHSARRGADVFVCRKPL